MIDSEFKETEVGSIPKEWKMVKLGEIIEVHDSKRVPLSEMERNKRRGYYPYCGANGIIDYIDDYIFNGEFILVAEDGGDYNKFKNTAYLMNGKFWVNNHAHILSAISSITFNLFLLYSINFLDINPYVVGSTRKKLNQEKLKKIKLFLPPLLEQKKIAEILSTVDEAIEDVNESLVMTEKLKKELMQELLTEGIGHNEFKETEIGKIPKEWGVIKIRDIGKVFTGKTPSTSKSIYWNGDVPFITPEDMTDYKYISKSRRYVTEEGANQVSKILPKNAILVVCIGSTVGKISITDRKSIVNQQINAVICNDNIIYGYIYYAILFRSPILKNFSGVAAVPIIKKSLFETFKIPLPKKREEQERIAEILSTVDERIQLLKDKKNKLERVKKGLMNELLTGRRRVKADA